MEKLPYVVTDEQGNVVRVGADYPFAFRDQCAIAAMNGMLAVGFTKALSNNGTVPKDVVHSELSRLAFTLAEKMEAERKKRSGQ